MKFADPLVQADFDRRIAAARSLVLSEDGLTRGARDMLRIAAFAGFDAKDVLVRSFIRRRRSSGRINARTIENTMGEINRELKLEEG